MKNTGVCASIRPLVMKKHTISFRCPIELCEEVDSLCKQNGMVRSDFIIQALQLLLDSLAEHGITSSGKLPASAESANEQ